MKNKLLASIAEDTLRAVSPHLELIHVERGETLHDVAGPVRYLYFPATALISAFVDTSTGASAEVALIGDEGGLGIMMLLSGVRGNFRAVVDAPGKTYRVKLSAMRSALEMDVFSQCVLMRYLTARTVQIAVNAVCNAHHSVQQRLCRALLMRLEKSRGSETILVTQAMLADILGARRTGVTRVALELRRSRVIDYARGRVTVVDRAALERSACECEVAIRAQTRGLTDPAGPAAASANAHVLAR